MEKISAGSSCHSLFSYSVLFGNLPFRNAVYYDRFSGYGCISGKL